MECSSSWLTLELGGSDRERFGPSRWTLLHYAVKVLRSADPAGQAKRCTMCAVQTWRLFDHKTQEDIGFQWISICCYGFPWICNQGKVGVKRQRLGLKPRRMVWFLHPDRVSLATEMAHMWTSRQPQAHHATTGGFTFVPCRLRFDPPLSLRHCWLSEVSYVSSSNVHFLEGLPPTENTTMHYPWFWATHWTQLPNDRRSVAHCWWPKQIRACSARMEKRLCTGHHRWDSNRPFDWERLTWGVSENGWKWWKMVSQWCVRGVPWHGHQTMYIYIYIGEL